MAFDQNRSRLLCMLALTFSFFVVEVVVSHITSSLSMLSDSFHMLSDVIALAVALIAMRFAEKTHQTDKNTFGWIRADVMGALVNAIFLTALCFTIVLEAIGRFTEPHEIEKPDVLIWVGVLGLLVNVIGLFLFHGHSGHGHGHSHGGNNHESKKKNGKNVKSEKSANEETSNLTGTLYTTVDEEFKGDKLQASSGDGCKEHAEVQMNGNTNCSQMNEPVKASQLNMHGVFLHVLGDALGSVIVVINALIFKFVWEPCEAGEDCVNPCVNDHRNHLLPNNTEFLVGRSSIQKAGPCWVLYLDPTLCLIMVTILLYTTYPLLKESALILLQTVPNQIQMNKLNERLLKLDGVLAVHDLHVWQLAGSRIIATAHIKCQDPASYMETAKRIKDFFHNEGIHATTIQPEFDTVDSRSDDFSRCNLSCEMECKPKLCCVPGDLPNTIRKSRNELRIGLAIEEIPETEEAESIRPSEVIISREVESSL